MFGGEVASEVYRERAGVCRQRGGTVGSEWLGGSGERRLVKGPGPHLPGATHPQAKEGGFCSSPALPFTFGSLGPRERQTHPDCLEGSAGDQAADWGLMVPALQPQPAERPEDARAAPARPRPERDNSGHSESCPTNRGLREGGGAAGRGGLRA